MSLAAVFNLYSPFLKPKKNNLWQSLLIALLILGNITQAILIVVMNTLFTHLFGILFAPQFTFVALAWAASYYLLAVGIYFLNAGLNSYLGDKLIHYLNMVVTSTLLERWISSKAYFGSNFLAKRKVINPAGTLSNDIQEANRLTVKLGDNLINTFFAFLAGMYGLWTLSFPLTFQISTFVFVIPGYMAIGALLYAIVNNYIVNKIGFRLKKVTEKQHSIVNKLEANIHHVEKHAKGIELLRATAKEMANFTKILHKSGIYNASLAILQAGLAAFTALNDYLRSFVAIMLSVPQILAKQMTADALPTVWDYFTKVTSQFTWPYDNYEDVTSLDVLIGKIFALKAEIAEWEQIKGKNKLTFSQGFDVAIDKLIITKPDQSVILNTEHFTFKDAVVSLIQGPSGAGKSTLIDAMTGLWPYVTGIITLPCPDEQIHVIPQKSVFPMRSTLYEAVLYTYADEKTVISKAQKDVITALLVEFKLDNSILLNSEDKRDWSKTLSGGEQQRIALIRAILHPNLKLLLMDEPFSALDHHLRLHCEQVLKKHLAKNKVTIIFIDHRTSDDENKVEISQPSPVFFDERVVFKNRALCRS